MKRTSLTVLLPAVFVISVLSVLAVFMTYVMLDMRKSLLRQTTSDLSREADLAVSQIEAWFTQTERNIKTVAQSDLTLKALKQFSVVLKGQKEGALSYLQKNYVAANPYAGSDREKVDDAGDRTAYSSVHAGAHDYFRSLRRENGYYDMFLFDADGLVIYTVVKEGDLGQNANDAALRDTGLGRAFSRAWTGVPGTVVFEDFKPYVFSGNVPAGFLATAILNEKGEKVGVLAIQIPSSVLTDLLDTVANANLSAEITMIGPDGTYRMEDDKGHILGAKPVQTPQVLQAVQGRSGVMSDVIGQSGRQVVVAYRQIRSFQSNWSVLAEADLEMLMAPVREKTRTAVLGAVLTAGVLLALGLMIGRWIAHPLARLNRTIEKISRREAVAIDFLNRRDEVGDIARGLENFRAEQVAADGARLEMLFKGQAFATSSSAMVISDRAGTILYLNEAATRIFTMNEAAMRSRWPDFDANTLIGRNISVFHKSHDDNMARLTQSEGARLESDIEIGDQTFSLSINPVKDQDNSHAGYVVVWENVKETRRTAAIVDAIDRMQTLVELTPEGFISGGNDNCLLLYGYSREELVGKPFSMLFRNGTADATPVLQRVLERGSLAELHHRVNKDGRELWVFCNINAIRNRAGRVTRLIGICTDMTAETLARHEVDRLQRKTSAEQQQVVDALRTALADLAVGDLTSRLAHGLPAEYDVLRENFNRAAESLEQTLSRVASVAERIVSGAADISGAASDLSRRTESQAATLEETAAALDTLTSNVRAATNGTQQAGARVLSAHAEAKSNGQVVEKAIEAMGAIESSSQQIAQIISVIDDIAFQTNLLALNAGVEAARAGDAGRGFAVVAAEVRALAQRSSEAAKEIKDLITASEEQVSSGAGLVARSGEAVQAIVADVAEISRIVQAISQSSQDQSNGLAEINTGVSVLDKVTQQNAAMVEQSTAASQLLRQEASELSSLLQGFRLSGAASSRRAQRAA